MRRFSSAMIVLCFTVPLLGFSQKVSPGNLQRDLQGSPLPNAALVRLGTSRFRYGHCSWALGVSLSPGGNYLATSSYDTIHIWDVATGQEIRRFQVHSIVDSLAFSPDGKLLASGQFVGSVCLWEVSSGKEIRRLQIELRNDDRWASSVCFSPDGNILAVGHGDGTVRFWEVGSGKEIRALHGHKRNVNVLAFSPDGAFLASADNYPKRRVTIRVRKVGTGKELGTFRGHEGSVYFMAFSLDGKQLVISGDDQTSRLWETKTGKEVHRLAVGNLEGGCVGFGFSQNGKLLTSVMGKGVICQWDTTNWSQVKRIETGHNGIYGSAFSADGRILACCHDGVVGLWDLTTWKKIAGRGSADPTLERIHFSPDGTLLATEGANEAIRLWESWTGREICRLSGHKGAVVGFTADGRFLVTVYGHIVQFWNVTTGALIRTLWAGGWAQRAALSADRQLIVVCLDSGSIKILDVASGKFKWESKGCPKETRAVAFAPDAKTIAVVGGDQPYYKIQPVVFPNIHRWDVATGKQLGQISITEPRLWSVAFSPDGRFLAYGGHKEIALRDVFRGGILLRKIDGAAYCLSFSPGGEILACGKSTCESIGLLEAATGREICSLPGHLRFVTGLSFSPDGRRLASCSLDCTGLIWDMIGWGQPHGQKADPSNLEQLWSELANEDVPAAYRVAGSLVQAPEVGTTLLAKHLRPVPAVDAKALKQLVMDLDSSQFAVRNKASEALAAMGDIAESELSSALDGNLPWKSANGLKPWQSRWRNGRPIN